jgi:hypothetical protein
VYDDLFTLYVARWVGWSVLMLLRLTHQLAWVLTVLVMWLMTISPLPPGILRQGLRVLPRPRAPW